MVGGGSRTTGSRVAPSGASHPVVSSPAPATTAPSAVYGSGALAVREAGGTAGVTNTGGQHVFTSSLAPNRAHQKAHATTHATAPSPSTATGDVWSGFAAPAKSSPLSAAAAYSAGGSNGSNSQLLIGVLILGLGLVGMCTGAVAVSLRRRKATTGGVNEDR